MQQMHKTLYVGIDISLKTFDACAIDINSNRYLNKRNTYTNNAPGLKKFVNAISSIAKEHSFTSIFIGFEATGNYGFHLPFYLSESEKLKNFELKIFQINPKIIKNFRKAFSGIPKTDQDDSYVIAERLKVGKLYPYMRFDPHSFSLRNLTRCRFHIVDNIVSGKTRFISLLLIKAPGFVQNKAFSSTFGATSAALMTEFASLDEIIETPISDLITFISKKSKNKIVNPELLANKIKYIARESYKPNRIMHSSINFALLSSNRHIKFLEKELKQIEKEIQVLVQTFKNEYTILNSIKGIGPVFAAGIISEIGDISLFKQEKEVAKFAGLVWRIKESGRFKSEETALTKAGNKYLRYYLVQAAQSLSTKNVDFIPYYLKKYNEAVKHKHKRAVVLLARKLVRVIFALLKKNQLYKSPSKKGDIPNKIAC